MINLIAMVISCSLLICVMLYCSRKEKKERDALLKGIEKQKKIRESLRK